MRNSNHALVVALVWNADRNRFPDETNWFLPAARTYRSPKLFASIAGTYRSPQLFASIARTYRSPQLFASIARTYRFPQLFASAFGSVAGK